MPSLVRHSVPDSSAPHRAVSVIRAGPWSAPIRFSTGLDFSLSLTRAAGLVCDGTTSLAMKQGRRGTVSSVVNAIDLDLKISKLDSNFDILKTCYKQFKKQNNITEICQSLAPWSF